MVDILSHTNDLKIVAFICKVLTYQPQLSQKGFDQLVHYSTWIKVVIRDFFTISIHTLIEENFQGYQQTNWYSWQKLTNIFELQACGAWDQNNPALICCLTLVQIYIYIYIYIYNKSLVIETTVFLLFKGKFVHPGWHLAFLSLKVF